MGYDKGTLQLFFQFPLRCQSDQRSFNQSKMAADWTKAKSLNQKTQCLVFGFVKESQQLLNKDSSSSVITDLIIFIILSFYQIKDEWDSQNSHESYTIVGDLLIKKDEIDFFSPNRSAFLKHVVTEGIFKWQFKINKIIEPTSWDDFIIGVIDAKEDQDLTEISQCCYAEAYGAGFDAGRGKLFISNKYRQHHNFNKSKLYPNNKYGKSCVADDIIEMEINMNDLYVKYLINGEDYGKAFHIKDQQSYRAAVYMYKDGDTLEIV